eukprot:5572032-Pyramimonas_sp.AAC.1
MSLKKVDAMTEHQLIKNLTHEGFLIDWSPHFCPHCGKYSDGKFRKRSDTGTRCYRCSANDCHKFIFFHANHMVFTDGSGRSHTSLDLQVMLLLGLTAGLTPAQTHFLCEHGESFIGHFSARLDTARARYVKKMEPTIRFCIGSSSAWHDIEADE